MVYFLQAAGTQMLHVPYKALRRRWPTSRARDTRNLAVVPAALPMVQGGRVRPLGVTKHEARATLPDVP